ncbi:MAG TPA: hypothetical protein DCR35_06125 [Runella sp.]|nr:hypothetical protein [Runella sp.]
MRKILFLVWYIGLSLPLFGQTYQIERIGTDKGLSQGSVYAMLKDSRGFMWFGTQDGLNRYDGHHFKVYYSDTDQPNALHGGFVNSMIEAPNGDLWLGTDYGLNLYQRQTDDFRFFPSAPERKTPSACSPFAVRPPFVWYWSESEGIVKLNYDTQQKTVLLADVSYDLGLLSVSNATKFGKNGRLWVSLSEGLMQYDTSSRQMRYFFSKHPKNITGNPISILKILMTKEGLMYLSHSNGVTIFDPKTTDFKHITHLNGIELNEIYDLDESPDGDIWLATSSSGLFRLSKDGKAQQFIHQKNDNNCLSNNTISSVYISKDGLVWANPDPLGINLLIGTGKKFRSIKYVAEAQNSLSDPNVRTMIEMDKNQVWVGTEQGGINVWNKQTGLVEKCFKSDPANPRSVPSSSIYHFFRDTQQQLWIATYNGLAKYLGDGAFESYFLTTKKNMGDNIFRCLAEWDTAHLLVGTENGLFLFDKSKKIFIPIKGLENISILWIDQPTPGELWLTRFNEGCWKGTLRNHEWLPQATVLVGGNALALRKDAYRNCWWIATNNGLLNYQNGRIVQKFTAKDGLTNAYIYGLLLDSQHNLWLSTNRGLSSFNPDTRQFRNYHVSDGLQGYEFNNRSYMADSEGIFYFGGTNGFTYFRPNEIRTNTFQPQIQLTHFEINYQPAQLPQYIGETSELTLNADQNTFSLGFIAIDYLSSGKNNYQYRLVNLEDNWNTTPDNLVRYVQVPPGEYIFEVKASNGDGFWSDEVRRLKITVLPAFWQTWWFRLLNLLLLIGIGIGFYRWRIQQLQRQQRERLELIIKTQEAERKQLATELHDDLGMRLSTLQMYLSEIDISQNSRASKLTPLLNEAIADIRNLLRDLNPKLLFEEGLRVAVEEVNSKLNAVGLVKFELLWLDFPEKLPEVIEINLFRIIQELINNTLKHAEATHITLQLLQRDAHWVIIYEDNGRGFERQPLSSGFGLQNIENRVQLLKGQLHFDTAPQRGVHVTIEIPHH